MTIGNSLSALGLVFNTSGYTISGVGPLTLGSGGINDANLTSGTVSLSNNIVLAANQTWTAATGSTLLESGIISGTKTLTLNGGGTVVLSGANTYTLGTTVGNVTLDFNSTAALGTGAVTLNAGTILDNTSGAALTNSKNNTVTIVGDLSFTGTNNLSLGTGAFNATGNRTVTVNANILTVGAVSDTTGSFTVAGAGKLYTSGGTVSGGALTVTGTLGINADFHANAGLTGNGTIINTNALVTQDKWFFVTNASNNTFSGIISGGTSKLGLRKGGNGTLTMTGANVIDDAFNIDAGTVIYSGTHTNTTQTDNIGTTANLNAVLVLPAGVNFNSNFPNGTQPYSATLSIGTNGTAAGSVQNTGATFNVNHQLGVGTSGYGAYTQTAGNTTIGGFLAVGNNVNGGVVNMSGGNFTLVTGDTGAITLGFGSVNAGTYGVMNLSGTANVTVNGTTNNGIFIGEVNNGILNVSSNALLTVNVGGTPGTGGGVLFTKNAAGNAILNLDGGTVVTPFISKGSGTGTFNFNGGTLKANANATAFMSGLTNAYVYSGGGTIDDGGFNITIGQALLAPAGNGVSNLGLTVSGTGFIDTPVITVTGGGGTGATAVATVDSNGNLTGITITNPGTGYTSAPTFNIVGGGRGNTGSITGTATLVPNVSGGITKQGAGTTTFTGASTYSGATNITGGTLAVGTGGSILNSNITLTSGAINGTGTLGTVTVVSNANNTIFNGSGTSTALTINNLTFAGNATANFTINGNATALNTTNLTTSNGGNISLGKINININNQSAWVAGTYDLISYSTLSGVGFSDFQMGTVPGLGARLHAALSNPAGFIALSITGDSPKWSGALDGRWTTATLDSPKNWQLISAGTPTDYIEGDNVLFDDTATGTTSITISDANVSPTSVVFANSGKAYSVAGPFGIAGNTSVSINGGGTVSLSAPSTYSGGTIVSNSTLNINGSSAIGTGALTITGGTLDNTSGAPVTLSTNNTINLNTDLVFGGTNDLNLGTGNVALTVGRTITTNGTATLTIGGTISGAFGISKAGASTLALAGNNSYSGTTIIDQGTLAVIAGVTGTLTNTANSDIQISPNAGDSGTLLVTGGVVNANRVIVGGNSPNSSGGNGKVVQTGGTINSQQWFTVGSGNAAGNTFPAGEYDLSNGTLNVLSQQMEVANYYGTTGTVNMSGGNINLETNASLALGANNLAGDGTFTQSGGNVTFYSNTTAVGGNGILYLGKSASLAGTYTYNLNGGTLTVPQIQQTANSGGTGIFNFNGGTLKAAKSNANFMTGLSQANVGAGGAIIDDGGFAVTIGSGLNSTASPDGGLTKLGTGVLTMTGTSSYNGATQIQAGTLQVTGTGSINGTSGITVNGGKFVTTSSTPVSPTVSVNSGAVAGSNSTINTVIVASAAANTVANGNGDAGILNIGTLTYNGDGAANVTLAGPAATTAPGIVVGTLNTSGGSGTSTGHITVNATNSLWNNGVYDLIGYSTLGGVGFNDFQLGTITGLTPRQSASLTNVPGDIAITISGGNVPVWTGALNGNWTTATLALPKNWQLQTGGTPTDFVTADTVLFDDTATGTTNVNISDANVAPTSTTFNNSALNYTISSSSGFGISSGFLVKNGTGNVTISTANSYAGGTTLNAGTLNVNNAAALGTGPIVINGGTVGNTSGSTIIETGNGAVTIAGDFTFAGPNNLSLGTGTVTLSGTGTSRTINVTNGALAIGPIPNSSFGLIKTGAGTLTVTASANDNNAARITTLGGPLDVEAGLFQTGGNDFYAAGITGNGTIENGSNITRWIYSNTTASMTFGGVLQDGTGGGGLGLEKLGTGVLTLTGSNTYSSTTTIVNGTLALSGTNTLGGRILVGSATTSAGQLIISGGTTTATQGSAPTIQIGGNSGVTGVFTMTGGNLTTTSEIWLATADGGYGFMNMTGGNATVGSWLALGRGGGQGVLDVSGNASLSVTGNNLTIGSTKGSATDVHGVVNVSGNATVSATNAIYVGENTPGIMTMSGNATVRAAGGDGVMFSKNSATTSILNLNGGTLSTTKLTMNLAGTSIANFNGGVVKALGNTTTFINNISNAVVYAGGITLDDGGFNVTVPQVLTAPAGDGISATGLTVSGTGFIGEPVVEISGGGGSGATAVANIDASGNLTGITITNPGTGYTSSPSFTILGGGFGSSGSISGSATLVPNVGGGLTKTGLGSATLSGSNTYSGGTSITNGTLVAANVHALGTGGVAVHTGGTLRLQSGLAQAVVVPSLTFDGTPGAWTGSLDMTNNKMIVEATVSHGTAAATLESQAHMVMTSSTMAANYGIAVIDNAALANPFTTFGGQTVDANSILIAPELLGDSNADGKVDSTDLNAVLSHFGAVTPAWTSGNFDGSPTVDLTDLADVLNNFNQTNPNASIANPTFGDVGGTLVATPEPASLAVLAAGALALLSRRRRSNPR